VGSPACGTATDKSRAEATLAILSAAGTPGTVGVGVAPRVGLGRVVVLVIAERGGVRAGLSSASFSLLAVLRLLLAVLLLLVLAVLGLLLTILLLAVLRLLRVLRLLVGPHG
jgi:hypothetical protein